MPEAQSRWFYIVRQLQVAGKLSTKVAGNHLLLSVTGGSERCRSGSEISGARLYQRQGAERRSGGVEGCRIRDELNSLDVICTTPGQSLQSGPCSIPTNPTVYSHSCRPLIRSPGFGNPS